MRHHLAILLQRQSVLSPKPAFQLRMQTFRPDLPVALPLVLLSPTFDPAIILVVVCRLEPITACVIRTVRQSVEPLLVVALTFLAQSQTARVAESVVESRAARVAGRDDRFHRRWFCRAILCSWLLTLVLRAIAMLAVAHRRVWHAVSLPRVSASPASKHFWLVGHWLFWRFAPQLREQKSFPLFEFLRCVRASLAFREPGAPHHPQRNSTIGAGS